MFIKLDMSWFQHSFPMNSFKITTQQQLSELTALRLRHVRYIASRSDLASEQSDAIMLKPLAVADPDRKIFDSLIEAKHARYEKLKQQRAEIARCEEKFIHAAKVVKDINKRIFSRPQETLKEAGKLVDSIADVLLSGNDAVMHLIKQAAGSEELYFHTLNVSVLSMMLAHAMGCTSAQIKLIGMAGLFHDLGKVYVPDNITNKTSALSRAEKNFFEMHTHYGVDVGARANLPKVVLDVIASHHEFMDGSGYPQKLKGSEIRLPTRIVTIANVYDNLCNHVDPSQSLNPHEALATMYSHRRAQFDPAAMAMLVRCLGVYPPGTLVRLSNEATGLVMSVNLGNPLRPHIMVYDDSIAREEAIILDLAAESHDLVICSSVRPGSLPRVVLDYLNPRKKVNYYVDSHCPKTPLNSASVAP